MTGVKHIPNQSIVFTQIKHTVVNRHDTSRILTTVL